MKTRSESNFSSGELADIESMLYQISELNPEEIPLRLKAKSSIDVFLKHMTKPKISLFNTDKIEAKIKGVLPNFNADRT